MGAARRGARAARRPERARAEASERHRVLVMPECTDPAALHASYRTLVSACIERGFRLGERLHIALFGHTPGT